MFYIDHPFLVQLKFTFQTPQKIYFVMEYQKGGPLFKQLRLKSRFTEQTALFFASQIILALEYLHSNSIIYRDLKPENILLDEKGYIKLTEFEMAKKMKQGLQHTSTFIGTPEYQSPQIIQNQKYSYETDWWAFGTLLYELVIGIPPFYDQNIQKMY